MRILNTSPDIPLDGDLLARAQATVRARIRELRQRERLSQAEAAARLGWGQPYWSRIEAGGIDLKLDHLLGVQHALGLDSVEALFGPFPSERVVRGETTTGPA